MKLSDTIKDKAIQKLNEILELEMSGVVRYTHYSLMIIGHNRIPITAWMKSQAQEGLRHAIEAGEMITHFEEHPSLRISNLKESYCHNINQILEESLEHEKASLKLYYDLLDIVLSKSVLLEEYARKLIVEEEMHIGEVEKMLRVNDIDDRCQ
ncbi:ferritin-like domain-containing protein [Candidatus Bandiella numerosa]|uniref:ferritin-like domain-containing protein n=1 Tax=Candidatus Bandiella numerosa TaxID=2570586 RepID=UPI00249D8EC1|nr:ferritin-like domain-containing protein [Candidatus Bandiella numerosa]WHA04634.1 ferritin-like domain-containing protein [Candidatus Bandiella numerosa]